MSGEQNAPVRMEIGHVLAMDFVGYSNLLIHEQSDMLERLNEIARGTNQFRAAEAEGKLIRLPTGDGMALVFFNDPQAPIECAMEIAAALKSYPDIKMRMGIHSGPINEVLDVNERTNVAGAGIDLAQRVMDCGDAGHILLSKRVADDLAPYSRWHRHLHALGECAIKHGRRISLVNFYTDEIGNAQLPDKLKAAAPGSSTSNRRFWLVSALILSLITLAIPLMIFAPAVLRSSHREERKAFSPANETHAAVIPDKSIAVLPFENRSDDKANAYFADGISG